MKFVRVLFFFSRITERMLKHRKYQKQRRRRQRQFRLILSYAKYRGNVVFLYVEEMCALLQK